MGKRDKKIDSTPKEEVKSEQPSKEDEPKEDKDVDELSKCKDELKELNDKYLRAHADFENMKKRLERDKASAVSFANEKFATDLLSVIDSFESAIASIEKIEGDEVIDKIKEGVSLTYEQLLKVLKKHGVEEIANEGVFDPNVHQVVQQVDSDEHEKDEIVNTLQKGYKLKDRVLRPSIVVTKR